MSSSPETWAIIVAAGRGLRFEAGVPKQFASLAGRPMVIWAIEPFRSHPAIVGVTLVVPEETVARPPEWLAQLASEGVRIVEGGAKRTDSVRFGLETVSEEASLVAVHDGARPLITAEAISNVIAAAKPDGGAVAARRVTDSLKRGDARRRVTGSVDREGLWRAETPQIFPRALIIDVHRRAELEGVTESDCAGLCQRYGIEIELVEIEDPTPKITRAEDLAWAEAWVARHKTGSAGRRGA